MDQMSEKYILSHPTEALDNVVEILTLNWTDTSLDLYESSFENENIIWIAHIGRDIIKLARMHNKSITRRFWRT